MKEAVIGERTPDGCEVRLRPRGRARFVDAGFLIVWLSGWLIGEVVAVWLLAQGAITVVTGEPGRGPLSTGVTAMAGTFLIVWLTLWTLGGIAATGELLRSLWGEDRMRVSGGTSILTRVRGPFA